MTDPQLYEVLHQIGSCGLPDPISAAVWHAREDSIQQSAVQADEHPATLDSHLDTELRVGSIGSVGDSGSQVRGGASRAFCEEAGRCSRPSGLLEVKQQQVRHSIISFSANTCRPCRPSSSPGEADCIHWGFGSPSCLLAWHLPSTIRQPWPCRMLTGTSRLMAR